MAAADWRSAALIASIRRRGNAPSSSSGWNDTDFLAAINEELRGYLVPLIRRVNEDYLVAYTDVPIDSGTARYRIPEAALGEALKDVGLLDSNGDFQQMNRVDSGNRDIVSGYYLEDEDVVLTPTPTASDTMRLKYIRRPSKLVADSRCYKVTTSSVGSLIVTNLDSDVTTTAQANTDLGDGGSPAAVTYDVVSARPGFRVIMESASGSASGNTITDADVTAALAIAVGDYVCVPGEAPVPQVPAEAHPLLGQAVLCQYLRASSQPGLQEAEGRRAQMEADLTSLLTPRTENQAKVVINPFGAGMVTTRGRRWSR